MNKRELKDLIIRSLKKQGFRLKDNQVLPPRNLKKEKIRDLHAIAVKHRIQEAGKHLARYEPRLLERIADGYEVVPEQVSPKLVEVQPSSEDEKLFRYAALHWSIPISSGYGRRLRFLVIDEQNEKLIGLIGLGDPVFSLSARDKWIGWDQEAKKDRLSNVMDAFVLGAVPPYSLLRCGKLVAMLTAGKEVRIAFKKKYEGRESRINAKQHDARLALVTTTSALGRSSIYNRLKYQKSLLYYGVGFTQGFGEFHFSNGLYKHISEFAAARTEPTAKHERWGEGFRNRREVVKNCLKELGITNDWTYHGIKREIFVIPMAKNADSFLRGEHSKLLWYNRSVADLTSFFKGRWMLPRCQQDRDYQLWERETWRLWPTQRK